MLKYKLIFFSVLLSIPAANAQEDEDLYLLKNNTTLSAEYLAKEGFSLMDSDILKNKIFLVGEDHLGKKNGEIHSLLLKYLSSKKTKIHILLEEPLSLEYSINKYIHDGDTLEYQFLKRIYSHMQEEMIFFNEIRSLVKEGHDVRISAIDIENNWNLTVKRLHELIPDTDIVPKGIQQTINRIKTTKYSDTARTMTWNEFDAFVLLAEELDADLKTNPDLYKEYFKENYQEFKDIVPRFLLGIKNNTSKIANKKSNAREKEMYSNIVKVIKESPDETFFGNFGFFHTALKPLKVGLFRKNISLATMLNTKESSPVNSKVCSITIGYMNYKTGFDYYFMKPADIDYFLKYSISALTLFKLNSENSPFKKMAGKFQYIVINKY